MVENDYPCDSCMSGSYRGCDGCGYAEKKEVDTDKQEPRICEVLEVEVGEVFTADTPYGRFTRCVVNEDGQLLHAGTNALCYIINHPESIIRQPI